MSKDWRYAVDSDGIITRGRMYRLSDTGCDTSDEWRWYWESDGMVGFYEEYARGRTPLNDSDECKRAISAYQHARNEGDDTDVALRKVARRITGEWSADFVCVGLDRGMDFYALSWGGDPEGVWRDEIEAVYHGDIYRCEVEEYTLRFVTPDGEDWEWVTSDDVYDQWYGEDKADAAHEEMFSLAEFPAELLVSASD